MPRRHHDLRGQARRWPRSSTTWASTSSRPASPSRPNGDFEAVSAIAKADQARRGGGPRPRHRRRHRPLRRGRAPSRVRPRIHTFVSTSPIHLAHQMNKSESQVLEIIARTVTQARNLVADVEWSAMDATRTPIDYLCRCVEAAIQAGATTINLPDTVGFAVPAEYQAMFRAVRERVPNSDKAVFSVHCHDDLGLAVANSLAGVAGGARQIECTINGLGERAGNAALEEIVMALRTRGRRAALFDRHRRDHADARLQARVGRVVLSRAVQQGDRRPERLRARERHPPGRHAEERHDLRDHDAGIGRRRQDLAGDGQALRPSRLQGQAAASSATCSATTPCRTPLPASRIWPTARRSSTTRISRRWSTTRSATPTSASRC